MHWVYRTFLKGLIAILPLAVTVYVLVWLAGTLEQALGSVIRLIIPDQWYVPGLGLAIGIVLVFVIGVLLQTWLLRRGWSIFERLFDRLPLIKTVYSAVKDMMGYFSGSAVKDANQVVLIKLDQPPGAAMLGFITRDRVDDLKRKEPAAEGQGGDRAVEPSHVAVYLPMSYQIGGFTVFISRDRLIPLDMSLEQAMRFAMTAGVKSSDGEDEAGMAKAIDPVT